MHRLLLLLLVPVLLPATTDDRGITFGGSVGIASGGFGPFIEYQLPYTPNKRITLSAGGGISGMLTPAYSAGISHEFGIRRRLTLSAAFGTFFSEKEDSYGTGGEHHYVHELAGPSFTIGYKRTGETGGMLAIGGGIFVPINQRYIGFPVLPALNLCFGWKMGRRHDNSDTAGMQGASGPAKKASYTLPANLRFINNIAPVNFIVTNPRYLLATPTSRDTADQLHLALRSSIYKRLNWYSLSNFSELPDDMNRKITVGFNSTASKNSGNVDSLPYAILEDCTARGLKFLAVFYVYKTNDEPLIEKNEMRFISFPAPVALLGSVTGVTTVTIPIYIAFDNLQLGFAVYDVQKNRRLYHAQTSDDDYAAPGELVDDLFDHLGMW